MKLAEKIARALGVPEGAKVWDMAEEPPEERQKNGAACGPPPGGYREPHYWRNGDQERL